MVEYSNQSMRPDMATLLMNSNSSSHTTKAQPVLEKLETIVSKDIIQRPHVIESHQQDLIEVHEQPIQKTIVHPTQEIKVNESVFVSDPNGKQLADNERDRVLTEMEVTDSHRPIVVDEIEDVTVRSKQPTNEVIQEVRKEIIEKPVVTEVHQQPITEIHDQNIYKTVHDQPTMVVVRESPSQQVVTVSDQSVNQLTPIPTSTLSSSTTWQQQPSTVMYTQPSLQPTAQPITTQAQPAYSSTGTRGGFGSKIKNTALKIKRKLILPRQTTTQYTRPATNSSYSVQPQYRQTQAFNSNIQQPVTVAPVVSQQPDDQILSHTTTTRTQIWNPSQQQQTI